MWRRRPLENPVPLLLVALLPWYGCAPQAGGRAEIVDVSEKWVAYSPEQPPATQPGAAQPDESPAARRVRELEQRLAQQDRQIAAVQGEIQTTRGDPRTGASPRPAEPGGAEEESNAAPAAPEPAVAARPPEPPPPAAPATIGARTQPGSSPDSAAPPAVAPVVATTAGAGALPAAATDPKLADAQRRIGRLERQLELEVKRRKDVEAEMARLLQETSSGPYEQASNVVEKHLREELGRARKEISQLRSTLLSERRERDDLERRYGALQTQVQATANAAPRVGVSNEEVEALKERQRRVLASIQQDLAASKQREVELRQTIEQSQGADGVSVAEDVSSLRSENSALQMRLDEEHQRNRDLSAKLQLATRVTDLIFKMQSNGAQSVAAVPLP